MRSATQDQALRYGAPTRIIAARISYLGVVISGGGITAVKNSAAYFTITLIEPMVITSIKAVSDDSIGSFVTPLIGSQRTIDVRIFNNDGTLRDGVNFSIEISGREIPR
jgi:hypothetical protein